MAENLQKRQKRDFQKSKVYRWEATLQNFYQTISTEDCSVYTKAVWGIYLPKSRAIPDVTFGRNGKTAWATDKRIHIPGKTRILGIILHESIHSVLYPDISVTHDQIFLLYLIDIYKKFGIGNEIDLEDSAIKMKLQISPKEILQIPIKHRQKLVVQP